MKTGSIFLSTQPGKIQPIRFFTNLLRAFWIFFPSLLFIVLALVCFTQLSQGRDLLISFTETGEDFGTILLSKTIFLIAILFWVYVSWYSSRMIAYIKEYKHKSAVQAINESLSDVEYDEMFSMELKFLHRFPRIIGYACLLVVLISMANLAKEDSLLHKQPFLFLIGGISILWITDRFLSSFDYQLRDGLLLKTTLIATAIILPLMVVLAAFKESFRRLPFTIVLITILLILYTLYINLRRHRMEKLKRDALMQTEIPPYGWHNKLIKYMMDFLQLPKEEKSYFVAFNIICLIGLITYCAAVFFLPASICIGPFPFVLLAFAVLLGFGNILTGLSAKWGLSLHFIIFALAAFLPTPDHHRVRTTSLLERNISDSVYCQRQGIKQYFENWLLDRKEIDSTYKYPMYIVLANGGASRAAYWVANVLGRMEDVSICNGKGKFSRQLFCLSGTSGGGVGLAGFYSMLNNQQKQADSIKNQAGYEKSASYFLRQDFLTFTLARMLGPDFFNYIPVLNLFVKDDDRAEALEQAFENAADTSDINIGFSNTYFDECVTNYKQVHQLPILFINTTRVKDGKPGVISNIALCGDTFNQRIDVVRLLPPGKTFRLTTAAILGARFPYVSPAGRIDSTKKPTRPDSSDNFVANYFVDGGYFDNSGAGVVQEMIRAMLKIIATTGNETIRRRAAKLSLRVIHITNSPQGNVPLKEIGPFTNDAMAPLLTIIGAFDMQTTVNDRRFIHYMSDVQLQSSNLGICDAEYIPIHLYRDPSIRQDTARGSYVMNWFMSDTVRRRMDSRLNTQPRLLQLLKAGTAPHHPSLNFHRCKHA